MSANLYSANIHTPMSPSGIDHLLHLDTCIDREDLNIRVSLGEHSEDLVCECLANCLDGLKIKQDSTEAIYSSKQSFCLRARDEAYPRHIGPSRTGTTVFVNP